MPELIKRFLENHWNPDTIDEMVDEWTLDINIEGSLMDYLGLVNDEYLFMLTHSNAEITAYLKEAYERGEYTYES